MINRKRLLKIILPATALVLLLAGCGSKSAQHKEATKSASAPASKVENHAPKDATTSDGGTKTTNTHTPNLYATPSQKQMSSADLTQQQASTPQKAQSKVAQTKNKATSNTDSSKAITASHKAVRASNNSSSSDDSDLPTIDLGDGVVGHEDRGAGQIYITFGMGDWKMEVHGNDVNSTASTAKDAASNLNYYLQKHSLPVPDNHGFLQLDATSGQATARWQEGSKVDSISGNINAILNKICE